MKPTITIVGSANVDYIMQVPHLPAKGETVMDATFFQAFGGKGANFCLTPERVDAVDTTAAGDTYCGALAVSLGEGNALSDAVRFAAAASALSVTKVGAQSSIPRREEIDDFLKKY